MKRHLPPLNQLRAFEAAARNLSFREAADELNVTHAAVSHQIKALEEILDAQLFHRVTRGVQLTEDARRLSAALTQSLDSMDTAVMEFRGQSMTGRLRISVVPKYGQRFLMPKLDAFHTANPGLELEFDYSYDTVDFAKSDFQAALRHGLGEWPGTASIRVNHDRVRPVCAPSLLEGMELPLSADQIATMKLGVARGHEEYWELWLARAGSRQTDGLDFVRFENRTLMLELALSGQGVSLSDNLAVQLELASGQLVELHPMAVELKTGMHLVYPETTRPDPRLGVVADWMRGCLLSDE
jgi:LysR family glycine cleavage system transcriptional activator